jgi:hypothetical protein
MRDRAQACRSAPRVLFALPPIIRQLHQPLPLEFTIKLRGKVLNHADVFNLHIRDDPVVTAPFKHKGDRRRLFMWLYHGRVD